DATTVPRLSRGDAVGRFVVLEPLGSGGMSIVYRAYDADLDRRVAVKTLHVLVDDAAAQRATIAREAQALARLDHPNVLAVYEVGLHGGAPFVAMELVEGVDLGRWLRTKRPRDDVLRVFIDCGRALQAAHEAGLYHRDFKPANVLIGDDGRVKVADFGLVRAVADPRAAPAPARDRIA